MLLSRYNGAALDCMDVNGWHIRASIVPEKGLKLQSSLPLRIPQTVPPSSVIAVSNLAHTMTLARLSMAFCEYSTQHISIDSADGSGAALTGYVAMADPMEATRALGEIHILC